MKALHNHETFKPSDLGKKFFFEETKKMRKKKVNEIKTAVLYNAKELLANFHETDIF
jgi:hypothetical protein